MRINYSSVESQFDSAVSRILFVIGTPAHRQLRRSTSPWDNLFHGIYFSISRYPVRDGQDLSCHKEISSSTSEEPVCCSCGGVTRMHRECGFVHWTKLIRSATQLFCTKIFLSFDGIKLLYSLVPWYSGPGSNKIVIMY